MLISAHRYKYLHYDKLLINNSNVLPKYLPKTSISKHLLQRPKTKEFHDLLYMSLNKKLLLKTSVWSVVSGLCF